MRNNFPILEYYRFRSQNLNFPYSAEVFPRVGPFLLFHKQLSLTAYLYYKQVI